MSRGGAGGLGAFGDEDRGVGDQGGDVAEQVGDQVDAVGPQVAEHAVPAAVPLVTPGEGTVGMGGVVAEQPEPGVRDGAEPAVGDHRPGGLHRRGVAVVEADGGAPVVALRGLGDRGGVRRGQPDGLLDPEMLTGVEHRDADLAVQEVRHGHRDGVDRRIAEDVTPVGVGGGGPEPGGERRRPPGTSSATAASTGTAGPSG